MDKLNKLNIKQIRRIIVLEYVFLCMYVVLECSVYLCTIHHLNYFVVTMSGTGNENFSKMEWKFRLCRTDQSKKTTVGGGPLGPENFHPERSVPLI